MNSAITRTHQHHYARKTPIHFQSQRPLVETSCIS